MSVGEDVWGAEVQLFLKKLKALDLGSIAYKLMHPEKGGGWTKAQTVRAIVRYLAFLLLIYLYPHRNFVPTQEIDAVWHQHILDTSKYHQDCEALFGRYVHHYPHADFLGEVEEQNWLTAFAQTQTLFDQHFGEQVNGSKIGLKDGD